MAIWVSQYPLRTRITLRTTSTTTQQSPTIITIMTLPRLSSQSPLPLPPTSNILASRWPSKAQPICTRAEWLTSALRAPTHLLPSTTTRAWDFKSSQWIWAASLRPTKIVQIAKTSLLHPLKPNSTSRTLWSCLLATLFPSSLSLLCLNILLSQVQANKQAESLEKELWMEWDLRARANLLIIPTVKFQRMLTNQQSILVKILWEWKILRIFPWMLTHLLGISKVKLKSRMQNLNPYLMVVVSLLKIHNLPNLVA